GKTFANYWMHNGYVTIGEDDEKMSKSLGNFVTVHDILDKMDPQVVRFFLSTTQYRRPIRYSQKTLTEANNNLQRLKNTYENAVFRLNDAISSLNDDNNKKAEFKQLIDQFIIEMDDDFNAANGITVVYEMAKWMNRYIEQNTISYEVLKYALDHFIEILTIFGVEFEEKLADKQVEQLILERDEARKDKEFIRSDEIRDQLKEQGIVLEDTPQGTRWRRKT
ncbi:DALR domain-containing protein, partial [Tetragenococcus halophilus]